MPYRLAGIDVHKKMLAVVVADVEVDGDFHFDRHKVGTSPADLRGLADWLVEHEGRGSRHGIDRAVLATGVGTPEQRAAPRRAHSAVAARRGFAVSGERCFAKGCARANAARERANDAACATLVSSRSIPRRGAAEW